MNRKIPSDAFSFYLSLGVGRSYESVAKRYGVSRRAVTAIAQREEWAKRIETVERKARERTDERAIETLEEMNDRHLMTMKLVQRKALEALRTMPLKTAAEAVRALTAAVDAERTIRGDPEDKKQLDVEAIIRREYELVMVENAEVDGVSDGTQAQAS